MWTWPNYSSRERADMVKGKPITVRSSELPWSCICVPFRDNFESRNVKEQLGRGAHSESRQTVNALCDCHTYCAFWLDTSTSQVQFAVVCLIPTEKHNVDENVAKIWSLSAQDVNDDDLVRTIWASCSILVCPCSWIQKSLSWNIYILWCNMLHDAVFPSMCKIVDQAKT